MLKRAICLLCLVVLACVPQIGFASNTFSLAGFDGDSSNHVWQDNGFFTRMTDATGVEFTFDEYTDYTKWLEAKQTMFSTNTLPDVLFKAELTTREQIEYAQTGQLIDLKPLLAENAPTLWGLLQANPEWLDAITLPDGKIVALPSITSLATQNAMWINRTWLDALKLETPTDWDSLISVLRAFKTSDPNGNGKADEIPITFLGAWDLKFLAHAFGLVANDYNVYVDANNTVSFLPEQKGYLTLLSELSAANSEGLLDPNGFYTNDTFRTVSDSDAAATYGVMFGPNPMNLLPYETSEQYEMLMPLTFDGKQVYRELFGSVIRGTFAITSACQDPARLLQWVDRLYTQEGAIEAMVGKQDKDYAYADDGSWDYAGDLQALSSSIMYDLSIYDTGNMPWLFPVTFYTHYKNERVNRITSQLQTLQESIVRPFPTYTLTPEQEDTIAPVQADLAKYVDESFARFVLGEWDIDNPKVVDAYLQGLQDNGSTTLITFWQEVVDSKTR